MASGWQGGRRQPEPVLLNVYDLIEANEYVHWVGLGAFHSGVEIYGKEYSYGGHEFESTGVFELEPKTAPSARFREQIKLGETTRSPAEISRIVEELKREWKGNTYNILDRNCNHFSDELARQILEQSIPGYINRLAAIGGLFRCILPDELTGATPVTDPNAPLAAPQGRQGGGGAARAVARRQVTAFEGQGFALRGGPQSPTRVTATAAATASSNANGNGNQQAVDIGARDRALRAAMARLNSGLNEPHTS